MAFLQPLGERAKETGTLPQVPGSIWFSERPSPQNAFTANPLRRAKLQKAEAEMFLGRAWTALGVKRSEES